MKITLKRAKTILTRYDELHDLAKTFLREKHPNGSRGPIRFLDDYIEQEVNTACHCHPEYEWVSKSSMKEFAEWLDKIQ